MAQLQGQFLQGKLFDTNVRCVVQPEPAAPEEQEQGSSSKKRKATSTEAPCRALRSSSINQQQQPRRQHQHAEKRSGRQQGGAAMPTPPHARKNDILCHAVVLCARSPYFEASLGGGWNEAQSRTEEIELENEQAVEDMKLLVKLFYSGSYTKEDGEELLDRSTRMRLAFLGNAFEMEDCVPECLVSLVVDLTLTSALTILDDVPEELHGH